MYPQTPEEIKRTNVILAVFYGLLLGAAFWLGSMLFGYLFARIVPFNTTEETFREPLVAVPMGNKIYLAEASPFNLQPFYQALLVPLLLPHRRLPGPALRPPQISESHRPRGGRFRD